MNHLRLRRYRFDEPHDVFEAHFLMKTIRVSDETSFFRFAPSSLIILVNITTLLYYSVYIFILLLTL